MPGCRDAEKRASRLEHMSALQQQCLAAESPDMRAARLEHMGVLQRQCLAAETPKDRAVRLNHLQQNRDGHRDACQESHLPLLPLLE